MNNIKTRHQSKSFTIPVSGELTLAINLWPGKVVAAAIEIVGDYPDQLVNASVRDNGNRIEDPTSIQNWEQRSGGNYLQSLKPLSIEGGQQIKFDFTSSGNLAAELKGQVILVIQQNC